MNSREKAFFGRLREFATHGQQVFIEIERFVEYEEARFDEFGGLRPSLPSEIAPSAPVGRPRSSSPPAHRDIPADAISMGGFYVVSDANKASRQNQAIEATINNNLVAQKGGAKQEMPPKYKDGSFRIRANGLLEYRYQHECKTVSVYGKNEQECWDKRTAKLTGTKSTQKNEDFGSWLIHYYKTFKQAKNSDKTNKENWNYINKCINPRLGRMHLKNPDVDLVQNFINDLSKTPNKRDKVAELMCGAFAKAVRLNKIRINPFELIEYNKHISISYRALEIDEQRIIYERIKGGKYFGIFVLSCCTGIRISKALELDIEQNFDTENITVIKKQKKGQKKTYKVPYLAELLDTIGAPKEGQLFPGMTYEGVKQYFSGIYEELGIKKANIHSFRHTFISDCNYVGVPIKTIQEWAGHEDIATTMNIYTTLLKSKGTSPILEYIRRLKQAYCPK